MRAASGWQPQVTELEWLRAVDEPGIRIGRRRLREDRDALTTRHAQLILEEAQRGRAETVIAPKASC